MSSKDLRTTTTATLWEEAGAEFYQENYHKGARANSAATTMARISLPSHTARRNSGIFTFTTCHRILSPSRFNRNLYYLSLSIFLSLQLISRMENNNSDTQTLDNLWYRIHCEWDARFGG